MLPTHDCNSDYEWALDDAKTLLTSAFAAASPAVPQKTQDIIVKYLAAHFITMQLERGGLTSQKIGESQESYGVKSGMGLNTSRYGQMAIQLDPTRALAKLAQAQGGIAQFSVVARPAEYDT
jgi:hypothetical protein